MKIAAIILLVLALAPAAFAARIPRPVPPDNPASVAWRQIHLYWNCFQVAPHEYICPMDAPLPAPKKHR